MSFSRRQFLIGAGIATLVSARGMEAWAQAASTTGFSPDTSGNLLLHSNENPVGPGQHVVDAVLEAIGDDGAGAGRYVFAQQGTARDAIAASLGLTRENVMLGLGSGELLRVSTETYCSTEQPYVTADPSFTIGERWADLLGYPVKRIPLDASYRVDLDAMLDAASGAGLVYVCNPNNPTATIHSGSDLRSFIATVLERSPGTKILVDEAYCDYVVDDAFESMLDLVAEHPQIIIARTFSKAYGMAGLRIGYAAAHPDTISQMSEQRGMDMYTSFPSRAGAIAALAKPEYVEQERARNLEVRKYVESFLSKAGLEGSVSQTNFMFFDTGQPGESFRQACLDAGVQVRAEYPTHPTHARVSLGTMAEMQQATDVFSRLL